MARPVRVGLLGPVSLQVDGRDVPIGGARRRSALALLSLAGRAGISATSLAGAMFGDAVDARTLNTLQVHLSQLRGQLAPYQGALARVGPSYRLDPDLVATDARRTGAGARAVAPGRTWRGDVTVDGGGDTPGGAVRGPA